MGFWLLVPGVGMGGGVGEVVVPAVGGPFRTAAAVVFKPGAREGTAYTPGSRESVVYRPGSRKGNIQ